MDGPVPVEVPVGIRAIRWSTVPAERTVLVVVHNVTTVTRLLDVLPAFENDFRIQLVFSSSGSDPFQHGLRSLLDELGAITIPWSQARQEKFDLVLSASHHGGLGDITGPTVIFSHGIGYTKYSPGNRKPETGNRQTFGLSPQWVLYDGEPVAEAFVLSHEEQLTRLIAAAPAAAEKAVIAGDPCYDRILASVDYRDRYRKALNSSDRTVVMVSSTWWSNSLLGSWPDFLRGLLSELPIDRYQVIAALHPNVRHGHSPLQINTWLADCLRSGLILLPEIDGWRAGLIAADLICGDHGSVTGYGAALRKPTVLAAFGDEDVATGSPISLLGATAPRLTTHRPLLPQIRAALDDHDPGRYAEVADLVTSVPGESLARLRTLFYSVLNLPEPQHEPPVGPIPAPVISADPTRIATRVRYELNREARLARLVRYPAEVWRPTGGLRADDPADTHLSCPDDYPIRSLRTSAAILTSEDDVVGANRRAIRALLGDQRSVVTTPVGDRIELSGPGCPPEVHASVVYAWLNQGHALGELAPTITVELGGQRYELDVTLR
ncbi:hypothetical protein [Amycolatopsis sp. H20-H5]|uniref:hypothetical protein n=1 Tax=Amycolatopsis sp. H20-H5 TaxID=3046309 RepID=UPI002DB97F09|nr:hypothetical protein [Amycolatopsis sp. H20-H5]MEC3978864.1 hypothetical protein [Amycolatopsis sp. H20-H5]